MTEETTAANMVFVGKIIHLEPIPNADLIVSAKVICGKGGKWRGVVKKDDFEVGSKCLVYLPDSLLPQVPEFAFMEKRHWRVRMSRFRGAPSEVLIMPIPWLSDLEIGTDVTATMDVTKYFKPVPADLQCDAKGAFPGFIPKTDELNYQRYPELVEQLHGKPYYITEKADGSSTTAFKYKREFGICSRNWELKRDESKGYWQVATKYKLEENLMEGYAIQWETCGPKIQSNPMGLKEIDGFAFSAFKIDEHRYLSYYEFLVFCKLIGFPTVKILRQGDNYDKSETELLGEGTYANGKQREGVVVRSQHNIGHAPISFKVINLNYEV